MVSFLQVSPLEPCAHLSPPPCFGCQPHPSSGIHKTVTTATGTGHNFCAATSHQRGQPSFDTLVGGSCTVPEAVVIVLCIPDDGCG